MPGRETESSGLYSIQTEGAGVLSFALAIDPLEGDLDRLSLSEVGGIHPALVAVRSEAAAGDDAQAEAPRRGELWRPIAALCLAFLVLESLWGAWIGRRRRVRA